MTDEFWPADIGAMMERGKGELEINAHGPHLRRGQTVVSFRRRFPRLATLRTCMLFALVLVAIGCRSRNAQVAVEPRGMGRRKLTDQDAKIALVEMLRREAVRDPKRCQEVWGSTEPNRQLATVTTSTNIDGTGQVGIFTVRLDKENYYFWGGLDRFEGSFEWEHGGWRASDRRMTAHGCIIGRGGRNSRALPKL
ncbi:MAG: hypothetical protein ACLQIB_20590 [Isosphaeraceae bacterium]